MFLSGPWTHLKKMMEKGRIVATIIYFLSMFLTLFCAIHVRVRCSRSVALPASVQCLSLIKDCMLFRVENVIAAVLDLRCSQVCASRMLTWSVRVRSYTAPS